MPKTQIHYLTSLYNKWDFAYVNLYINGMELSRIARNLNEDNSKFLDVYIDELLT